MSLGYSPAFFMVAPLQTARSSYLGFTGVYEFRLSERFRIGLPLSYRMFQEASTLHQVSYGVLLKHMIPFKLSEQVRPYFAYGLRSQQIFVSSQTGSALAHDTQMTFGGETSQFFGELSYHVSPLRFFNQDPLKLNYMAMTFGWFI